MHKRVHSSIIYEENSVSDHLRNPTPHKDLYAAIENAKSSKWLEEAFLINCYEKVSDWGKQFKLHMLKNFMEICQL